MVSIQRIRTGQADLLMELIRLFHQEDGRPADMVPTPRYLNQFLADPQRHAWVAMDGPEMVAGLTAYELDMAKSESREMFLFEISVRADYRRKGIGLSLLAALKKACTAGGVHQMFVLTGWNNPAAQGLYAKAGGKKDMKSTLFSFSL